MNINRLFGVLPDNISSVHTLNALGRGLGAASAVGPAFVQRAPAVSSMLDNKNKLKQEIASAVIDENRAQKSIKLTKIRISEIYKDKCKKATKVFNLSLITVGVSIALLLLGLIVAFILEDKTKLGIITSAASFLPGFIAATAFQLYKKEKISLQEVESDIRKMETLEFFFEMIRYIGKEQREKAYLRIIEQMKV